MLWVTGRITSGIRAVLVLPGILSLPTGGHMFAVPFVFLIPGAGLVAIDGVLVWRGRRRAVAPPHLLWDGNFQRVLRLP